MPFIISSSHLTLEELQFEAWDVKSLFQRREKEGWIDTPLKKWRAGSMEGIGHPWIDYYLPWNEHSMVQIGGWKTDPFPFGKAFWLNTPPENEHFEPRNHPIRKIIWTIHLHDFGFQPFFFQGVWWPQLPFKFCSSPTSPAKTRTTDSNLRMRGGSQRLIFAPPNKNGAVSFKNPPKN